MKTRSLCRTGICMEKISCSSRFSAMSRCAALFSAFSTIASKSQIIVPVYISFASTFGFLPRNPQEQLALSNSLRRPQLRAPGSRVAIALLFRCCRRFFGQHPEVPALHSTLAEGIFYDAVFQRVKTDHHHASSRSQNPRRRFEQRLQIVQFAFYEDSKGLKGQSRWMNPPVMLVMTPIHWPGRG